MSDTEDVLIGYIDSDLDDIEAEEFEVDPSLVPDKKGSTPVASPNTFENVVTSAANEVERRDSLQIESKKCTVVGGINEEAQQTVTLPNTSSCPVPFVRSSSNKAFYKWRGGHSRFSPQFRNDCNKPPWNSHLQTTINYNGSQWRNNNNDNNLGSLISATTGGGLQPPKSVDFGNGVYSPNHQMLANVNFPHLWQNGAISSYNYGIMNGNWYPHYFNYLQQQQTMNFQNNCYNPMSWPTRDPRLQSKITSNLPLRQPDVQVPRRSIKEYLGPYSNDYGTKHLNSQKTATANIGRQSDGTNLTGNPSNQDTLNTSAIRSRFFERADGQNSKSKKPLNEDEQLLNELLQDPRFSPSSPPTPCPSEGSSDNDFSEPQFVPVSNYSRKSNSKKKTSILLSDLGKRRKKLLNMSGVKTALSQKQISINKEGLSLNFQKQNVKDMLTGKADVVPLLDKEALSVNGGNSSNPVNDETKDCLSGCSNNLLDEESHKSCIINKDPFPRVSEQSLILEEDDHCNFPLKENNQQHSTVNDCEITVKCGETLGYFAAEKSNLSEAQPFDDNVISADAEAVGQISSEASFSQEVSCEEETSAVNDDNIDATVSLTQHDPSQRENCTEAFDSNQNETNGDPHNQIEKERDINNPLIRAFLENISNIDAMYRKKKRVRYNTDKLKREVRIYNIPSKYAPSLLTDLYKVVTPRKVQCLNRTSASLEFDSCEEALKFIEINQNASVNGQKLIIEGCLINLDE